MIFLQWLVWHPIFKPAPNWMDSGGRLLEVDRCGQYSIYSEKHSWSLGDHLLNVVKRIRMPSHHFLYMWYKPIPKWVVYHCLTHILFNCPPVITYWPSNIKAVLSWKSSKLTAGMFPRMGVPPNRPYFHWIFPDKPTNFFMETADSVGSWLPPALMPSHALQGFRRLGGRLRLRHLDQEVRHISQHLSWDKLQWWWPRPDNGKNTWKSHAFLLWYAVYMFFFGRAEVVICHAWFCWRKSAWCSCWGLKQMHVSDIIHDCMYGLVLLCAAGVMWCSQSRYRNWMKLGCSHIENWHELT